jgi:hypothetical protein
LGGEGEDEGGGFCVLGCSLGKESSGIVFELFLVMGRG